MDKSKDVSKNADDCFKIIKTNIEKNFLRYYKYDKECMEKILAIVINEASPKSNKMNIAPWEIINLFLRKSEQHIDLYLSKRKGKDIIFNKNTISESLDSPSRKGGDIRNTSTYKEGKAKSTMALPKNNNNDKNYFIPSSSSVYINDYGKNMNKNYQK
jgi:hypothetical protein